MSLGGGMVGGPGDKGLKLGLLDTLRLAWADPELRGRMSFVFLVFVIYALCINVPVTYWKHLSPEERQQR